MNKTETMTSRGLTSETVYMTLSDLLFHLRSKEDQMGVYNFCRKFNIDRSKHASISEKLEDTYFLNFKGRINSLKNGYEAYKSKEFHSDNIAASDWCYCLVDEKTGFRAPTSIGAAEELAKLRAKTNQ
jgi:hypothetical protein